MTTVKQKADFKLKKAAKLKRAAAKQVVTVEREYEEGRFFQFGFDPKRNVKTWELARCISLNMLLQTVNAPVPTTAVMEIEPEVRRHYVLTDVTEKYLQYQEDERQRAFEVTSPAKPVDTQLQIVYPDAK